MSDFALKSTDGTTDQEGGELTSDTDAKKLFLNISSAYEEAEKAVLECEELTSAPFSNENWEVKARNTGAIANQDIKKLETLCPQLESLNPNLWASALSDITAREVQSPTPIELAYLGREGTLLALKNVRNQGRRQTDAMDSDPHALFSGRAAKLRSRLNNAQVKTAFNDVQFRATQMYNDLKRDPGSVSTDRRERLLRSIDNLRALAEELHVTLSESNMQDILKTVESCGTEGV